MLGPSVVLASGNIQLVGATDGTLIGNNGSKLLVDGSGVTQPVSGTVTANQGTSPWITKDQNDGSATGGTAATFSGLMGGIFNTSLPTITNGQQVSLQLDTNGRLITRLLTSTDTVSAVQSGTWTVTANIGTTNGLALDATLAKLTISQGTALGTTTGPMVQGSVTTASPTYTTGQISPLNLTTAGALRIDGSATTQPVSGTVSVLQSTSPWTTKDLSDGSVGAGTAATQSSLAGLVFNTALPSLSTGQQAAIQGDASGRIIIAPLANTSIVKAQLQDNSGTAITLGQKTMASSVPVALASDQSAIPVTQSGTWTVQQGTPPWSVAGNVASGASDAGNPVKVGGVFNTSLPTLTTGQRGDIQLDASARLIIRPLTSADVVSAAQSGTWTVQPGNTANTTPWLTTINQGGNSATVTASNALKVDGSAVTQPVSGTVTANQGGTWTVQPGNTANTTPWLVTVSTALPVGSNVIGAVTQSGAWNVTNITGTVSLPTGASTAALQTTGNASLATLVTNTTGITVAQGSTTSGQSGQLVQGAVTTVAPAYTTAQTSPLSLTTAGALRVDASGTIQPVSQSGTWNITNISGTVSLPTGAATSALQTTGNTSLSDIDSQLTAKLPTLGQKTMTGSSPIVIASDQSSIPVADTSNVSGAYGAITVGLTAVIVSSNGTSNLAGRKSLTLVNTGTVTMFWGYDSSVTISTGTPLRKNQQASWSGLGPNVSVFVISTVASQNARVTENA